MNTKQINVLLLEDEAAHAEAIRRALESAAGLFSLQVAGSVKKYRELVAKNQPDIALLDMVLPDGNALDLLVMQREPNAYPMLVLTSHGNEQAAVVALKNGATDYIVKSPETFANMPRIVTSALNQWASIQEHIKTEQALQISETNFRNSIENSPLGIRIVNEEGDTLYTNRAFLDIYGYKNIEEFNITPVDERYTPQRYIEFQKRREKRQRREPLPDTYDVSIVRKDGRVRHLHVVRKEILWGGKLQYQTIYQDFTEQKWMQDRLIESEARLRATVQNAPVGIATCSPDGKFTSANDAFCRILGYSENELQRLTFRDITHPEDVEESGRLMVALDAGKVPYFSQEKRYLKKDGTVIIGKVSVSLLREQSGNPRMYIAELEDLTERKNAEKAVKESETKYRLIVENTHDIIFTFNLAGEFSYVSPSVKNVLGYDPADFLGRPYGSLVHPDDIKGLQEALQRNYRDGTHTPGGNEYRIHDVSGAWHWHNASGTAVHDENGKYLYFIGVARDITDQKRSEAALKESEARFRATFRTTAVVFGVLVDRVLEETNEAFCQLLGYSRDEIIGKETRIFYPTDEEYQTVGKQYQNIVQLGFVTIETRLLRKNGEIISGLVNLSAFDKNDLAKGVVFSVSDITERKKAEADLKASEDKYSTLVEQSTDGILILVDRHVVFANQTMNEMTGYSQDDILGKPFYDLAVPEYKDMLDEIYRKRQAGEEQSVNHELEMLTKDGKKIAVETKLQPIDYKGMKAGMVVVHDISERKQAENALRSERIMLARTEGIAHVGSWEWDIASDTVIWSDELFRIFQRDPQEGAPSFAEHPALYHPYDMERLRQAVEAAVADGTPYELELQAIRKDGETRMCLARGVAEMGIGGQAVRLFGLLQDITERMQAERALKESEIRYHQLVDTITSGVIIYRAVDNGEDFIVVDLNNSAEKLEGINRSDIIGKKITEILPRVKKYPMYKVFQKVWWTGNSEYFSAVTIDDQSTLERWRDNRTYKLSSGEIVNVYDDITTRKQAEKALLESEEKYRVIVENTRDLIFTINDKEVFVYVSPSVKDMLGYNEAELIGKTFISLIHPEDVLIIQEETRASLQPGYKVSSDSEYRMRHVSGEWRWVVSRGTRVVDKNGRFLHFLGIARDITERKKAELSLREAEFRYRTVADFTYDWEYWQNPDKSYVYVSPSCERISGYKADDFIKNPNLLFEIILPADKELWLQHTKQISRQKGKYELQFRINKKNGGIVWIEHVCQPVINEQGIYLGNRASNRDITDRKQIEEEKERIEEKAQISARLAAIGEMAAGVAHEINNPLTSVLGFSQMIMEKENIPEDLKANLGMIADGSQRMAEIVKRLLMFARQAKPFKTSVNINEIIENTLKLRDYVLKTNSIEVIARLDPDLPWVSADPGQMQQVFLNLIVNAEQAMVKAHGRGTLTISTEQKGNNIRVSVKDDGPGISKENLGRLFEPFFTTKDPGEGTGLGLSLSRSIILEHNGTINVESELRHGATFIIELPVTGTSSAETENTNPVTRSQPSVKKHARILVIDDEPSIRELLEKSLSRAGHSVDVITDASNAIEIIDAGTVYEVIITDIRMPGMNGLELYTLIRRKMPVMENRIIFITGDVMGADIKAFINSNKIPYLAKPFRLNELEEKIDNILASN